MLKNYFVIALRTLRRRKEYASLNVVGLAIGLACCLLIALLTVSYDALRAATADPVQALAASDAFLLASGS